MQFGTQMAYSQKLRELFPDITLQAEDLLLLESFQINYLPDRVVKKEFAALLRKYAVVHRFLVNKHPPIESFLSDLLEENARVSHPDKIEEDCQEARGEGADRLSYLKDQDLIDSWGRVGGVREEIAANTPGAGKPVA